MASSFTVSEKDLFNFESFCDSKYDNANCQKYGFFKIKLDADSTGQCSSIKEFFHQFGVQSQSKIKRAVILSNPNDSSLFGFRHIEPTEDDKDCFIDTSYESLTSQNFHDSPTCCMKALDEGQDAFLKHFYTEVTSCPTHFKSKKEVDVGKIKSRALLKKRAFEKRQLFQKATTMEGKKRSLEMAMLSEKIIEPANASCPCETCNSCLKSKKSSPVALNGFLYCPGIEENQNNYLHLTRHCAMAHLCFKNMLADLDSLFGGVSYPGLHLGGPHSAFPLHTEYFSCWSFNFLLHGLPKFWIIIPPKYVSCLTDALQRRGFNGVNRWCRNVLNHKFYLPTPDFFKQENIPFEVVIQREGEGIVILPNAPHTGGNTGFNLAETCNFGTRKWIPYGCESANCPCMPYAALADLSDLVAVHEPSLLKAYLSNNVVNVVDDEHFLKSTVIPKKENDVNCPFSSVSFEPGDSSFKKVKVQVTNKRVKCPVCKVSWAYVQKNNIMTHLMKYHRNCIAEEIVKTFMQEYGIVVK